MDAIATVAQPRTETAMEIFSIVYTMVVGVDKEPHVQTRLRPVADVLVTPNTLEMVFNASLEIVRLALVL